MIIVMEYLWDTCYRMNVGAFLGELAQPSTYVTSHPGPLGLAIILWVHTLSTRIAVDCAGEEKAISAY